MNEITFKKIGLENIDSVIKLRLDLWKSTGKIKSDDEYSKVYEYNLKYFIDKFKKEEIIICVYEDINKSEIISIGIGSIIDKPPVNLENIGKEGYIYNINTVKEYRQKGYATNILKEIIKYFKEKNIGKITLISNKNSYKLYERKGFKSNIYYQEMIL